MSELNTYIRMSLWNPETKLWTYDEWQKGHSFTANFMKMWLVSANPANNRTITDTTAPTGTDQTVTDHGNNFGTNGGVADLFGIVVGTGTTAVALTDTRIETLIDDGTGTGELEYQTPTYTDPTDDASTTEFELHRTFNNNSGGEITIYEVGLNVKATSTPYYFLVAREILSTPKVIADGNSAGIDLRIQISLT